MSLTDRITVYKEVLKRQKIRRSMIHTRLLWRRKNPHNYTFPVTTDLEPSFPSDKVHVGNYTYGGIQCIQYTGDEKGLFIGHFCSIANGVKFLLGGDHDYYKLSTYPFEAKIFSIPEAKSKGPIIVEDDVWIGEDAIILSGVTLRRGTVVAARSVVTKSSEPYSIIAGSPARIVKYRFTQEIIDKLSMIDYSKLDKEFILKNRSLLQQEINSGNVDCISDAFLTYQEKYQAKTR